jgi:hypothetical protein
MCSDLNDDMLETISLSKFFSTGEGTEVRLEAINMEELDDTGVEMATGDIILVLFEDFIGAFERCSELGGQEIYLRTADVEEDEVTRLIDVLGSRVGRGDALEFVGVSTFLCGGAKRLEIVLQELDIFILTGELVRGFRRVHVNMVEVTKGKMVGVLRGLGVDITVDDD